MGKLQLCVLLGLGIAALTPDWTRAEGPVRQVQPAAAGYRLIVKLRDAAGARAQAAAVSSEARFSRLAELATRTGVPFELARSVSEAVHAVRVRPDTIGESIEQVIARIERDPKVEYVVRDRRKFRALVPNDPLYGTAPAPNLQQPAQQWWLTPPTGDIVSSIDAPAAWDITTGSPQIVAAVIDNGVLFDHPDLGRQSQGGKLLGGYDMISDQVVANDGNGRDGDASDPGDWVSQADLSNSLFSGCDVADSSWHGTHIAGIIGARTNNGVGVAGIGWNTPVLPVRVLGKCFGYDSDILAGMRWAAGLSVPGVPANPNPARVLNLSLGSSGTCSKPYGDVVSELSAINVLVVAAAGNDSAAASTEPANCAGVISVTALRHVGTKVGFANWGGDVTIAAPGGNCVNTQANLPCLYPIVSTGNSGGTTPNTAGMKYDGELGTSFSSPIVAGVAALMLSVNSNMTPAQVTQRLKLTARPFPAPDPLLLACNDPKFVADANGNLPNDGQCNCTTESCGAGMLDAGAAVRSATNPLAIVTGATALAGGQAARFDGSQSLGSPGASIVAYRWEVLGTGTATLASETSPTVSFTGTAGTYTLSLTVTDSNGRSDSRSVSLDVKAASTGGSGGGGGGGALSPTQLGILILVGFFGALARRRGR